jgi:hypothetical protein
VSITNYYSIDYLNTIQAEELDKKLRHIVEDLPDRVYHVMGSNAGAGSGEFHTYRHSRRREQERLKQIDEDAERQEKEKERLERLAELENADEEKTTKRRAKRQKKKVAKWLFNFYDASTCRCLKISVWKLLSATLHIDLLYIDLLFPPNYAGK